MNPHVVKGAASLLLGGGGAGMKNLLSMAAAGLVIFAGLGWYLDWYKVQRTQLPDGHQSIGVDINTPQIKNDWQRGRDKVTGYLTNKNGTPANPQSAPPQQGGYPQPPKTGYPQSQYPTQQQQYPQQQYPQQQYPQQQYPQQQYPQQQNAPGYPQQQPFVPKSNWTPAAPQQQGGSRPF